MRVTIAGSSFYLEARELEAAMSGVAAEPLLGACVRVGERWYPVMQVGAAVTGQDRRDMSSAQLFRALTSLGLECRPTHKGLIRPDTPGRGHL